MTENEAIEILNNIQVDTRDLKHALKCADLIETAVMGLEEVQAYRKIGTVEEFQECMEKKEPKKVNKICGAMGEEYECPQCGSSLNRFDVFAGHCKWCGQKVKAND